MLLAVLWGGSFVAIEVGLETVPPMLFAALRYDLAGVIVLAYAAYRGRVVPRGRDEWLAVGVTAAFVIAGYHGLLYLGERVVPGALAAVVVSLSPVLTAVFAAALLPDERVDGLGVVGLGFGVVGVVAIADPSPASLLSTDSLGILLVVLATASFALGSVLVRPLDSRLPLPALQGWAMVLGAGLLHAAAGARGESLAAVAWTPSAVASFLYLALGSGVVAFLLYFHLLDALGPTEVNLIGYLEPVAAALVAWVVLDHLVAPTAVAGFGAVFTGFALLKHDAIRAFVTGRRAPHRA